MNRRTITASVLAAAALLAVTGCQKQDGVTAGSPISFSVSVAGQDGTKAVLYNSANDIQKNGNTFACSAYNTTKGASLFTGQTVTYDGSKWSTATAYTWQPGETLKFHAVYPATAAGTEAGKAVIADGGTGISITNYAVASDAKDQTDVMFGYFTGNGQTSGVANIKFDHPFTAVRFKMGDIKDFIPGFTRISSITISNVYTGGTLAKWSGSEASFNWTPFGDKTVTMTVNSNPTEGADIVGTDANANAKAFTLIPQVMSSKPATITVNYNYNADASGSIVATINSVPSSDNTWKSGKVYTYTVNFKTMVLTIDDSGAVQTWATETVTDPVEAKDAEK